MEFYKILLQNDRVDWMKFKDPSGETDASNERDLNTFIALASETVIEDMNESVQFAKRIEDVAKSVQGNLLIYATVRFLKIWFQKFIFILIFFFFSPFQIYGLTAYPMVITSFERDAMKT